MNTLSDPARNSPAAPRAPRVAVIPPDAFDRRDLDDIAEAGFVFTAALINLTQHPIDIAGCERLCGAPYELARLHAALDLMAEAVDDTRALLATIESRARRTAAAMGGEVR